MKIYHWFPSQEPHPNITCDVERVFDPVNAAVIFRVETQDAKDLLEALSLVYGAERTFVLFDEEEGRDYTHINLRFVEPIKPPTKELHDGNPVQATRLRVVP